MTKLFNIWKITTYQEYLENWPAIPGKFNQLTDYQKSLGYESPEDFFNKQSFAAQELANNRVGNILDRVFDVDDLTESVKLQLKKFTYQTIDYLRMNDLVITEDVRTNQTSFNNGRNDTNQINIDKIEQYVGAMAWRSWILANIQDLYISWAKDQKIPFILDPEHFYTKTEIDIRLTELDDQIQIQQKMIDEKLAEFNQAMEERLSQFAEELPNNEVFLSNVGLTISQNLEFLDKTGTNLINNENFINKTSDKIITKEEFIDQAGTSISENDPFISKVADRLSESAVTKQYVDDQDTKILVDAKKYSDDQNLTLKNNEIAPYQALKKETDGNNTGGFIYQATNSINMNNQQICQLKNPSLETEATTKKYVDDQDAKNLTLAKDYANQHSWIKGEYKWMPASVNTMPTGWKKVSIADGYTLVSGKNDIDTKGGILSHSHKFNGGDYFLGSSLEFGSRLVNGGSDTTTLTINGNVKSVSVSDSTGNNSGNLAAGISAILWQYDPSGTFAELRQKTQIENNILEIKSEGKNG